MQTIKSALYSLSKNDFLKGLVLVVITVVLGMLQQAITAHGADFASYDWSGIGQTAITAGIGY